MSLSIGVVYRERNPYRLWLAIGPLSLLSLRDGLVERWELTRREAMLDHSRALLTEIRGLAVDELLLSWGATAAELDAAVRPVLRGRATPPAPVSGACTLCGVPILPSPIIRRCRACRARGRAGVRGR